jgi:catechol 2,3-dioxygenase-like lactoylglutathione lyase family enzyme
MRLNHLMLTVRNLAQSRDWYVSRLGLKVEFEASDIKFAALEDESGFGFLMQEGDVCGDPSANIKIYFQADDVDRFYQSLANLGVEFDYPPQQNVWGYGPQLKDPNGSVLRIFDQRSITK